MGIIFDYAKNNFRDENTYNKIDKSVEIIRKQLNY